MKQTIVLHYLAAISTGVGLFGAIEHPTSGWIILALAGATLAIVTVCWENHQT